MQPIIFDMTGEYLGDGDIWFTVAMACYVVAMSLIILFRRG